jgi:hypothetical protein
MARKRPDPVLTHTRLLCLAFNALHDEIKHWADALEGQPNAEEALSQICARQYAEMEAIRQMYFFETGVEM